MSEKTDSDIPQRIIVADEPEFTISYHVQELGEGQVMTFVHLDVYYFSASILRRIKELYERFRTFDDSVTLFCMGEEDDNKFAKFVSHLGFEYLRDIPCTDGKTRRLFVNFGPAIGGPKT